MSTVPNFIVSVFPKHNVSETGSVSAHRYKKTVRGKGLSRNPSSPNLYRLHEDGKRSSFQNAKFGKT
jgi:hypothetical protein